MISFNGKYGLTAEGWVWDYSFSQSGGYFIGKWTPLDNPKPLTSFDNDNSGLTSEGDAWYYSYNNESWELAGNPGVPLTSLNGSRGIDVNGNGWLYSISGTIRNWTPYGHPESTDPQCHIITVNPLPPELIPAERCGVDKTVDIPEVEGVEYSESREGNTVIVRAAPGEGFVFPESVETMWTFDVSPEECPPLPEGTVVPTTPKIKSSGLCNEISSIEFPEIEGVNYYKSIDGLIATVWAMPEEGYVFKDDSTLVWSFDLSPRDFCASCELPLVSYDNRWALAINGDIYEQDTQGSWSRVAPPDSVVFVGGLSWVQGGGGDLLYARASDGALWKKELWPGGEWIKSSEPPPQNLVSYTVNLWGSGHGLTADGYFWEVQYNDNWTPLGNPGKPIVNFSGRDVVTVDGELWRYQNDSWVSIGYPAGNKPIVRLVSGAALTIDGELWLSSGWRNTNNPQPFIDTAPLTEWGVASGLTANGDFWVWPNSYEGWKNYDNPKPFVRMIGQQPWVGITANGETWVSSGPGKWGKLGPISIPGCAPDPDIPIIPISPQLTPSEECDVEGDVQIPNFIGVKYEISREENIITVLATPELGYYIPEGVQTKWVFDVTPKECPPPQVTLPNSGAAFGAMALSVTSIIIASVAIIWRKSKS